MSLWLHVRAYNVVKLLIQVHSFC